MLGTVEGGERAANDRMADPALLARVLGELRELERRAGIDRTLAIGELILKQFFGGNPAIWRDRRRNKNNSVRRLANSPDCPLSMSALNEAVTVYVASLSLPCVRTLGHIGASHVMAVLGLQESERVRMLELAERERLSVREFRRQAVGARRAKGERRGRPPHDAWARALDHIREAVVDLRDGLRRVRDLRAPNIEMRKALDAQLSELSRLLAEPRDFAGSGPTLVRIAAPSAASDHGNEPEGNVSERLATWR